MTTVTDTPEPHVEPAPREINLNELYQELARQLHDKELECAELRGQLKLLERMAQGQQGQPSPNGVKDVLEPAIAPKTERGKQR